MTSSVESATVNDNSVRSAGFGFHHRAALALAGTIPLPSPFPASGRVYLIGVANSQTTNGNGHSNGVDFYLKSVQVISERNILSRTLEIDSVRAIGFHRASDHNGHDQHPRANGDDWQVVPIDDSNTVAEAMQRLRDARNGNQNGSLEVLLYEKAVLYVHEAAPVLHHQELGITAAISAEAGSMLADMVTPVAKGCC